MKSPFKLNPTLLAVGLIPLLILSSCQREQERSPIAEPEQEIAELAPSEETVAESPTVSEETDATETTSKPSTPQKSAEDIRFMAYNVENYLEMSRYVNGERRVTTKPEDEIGALVNVIVAAKPDVLGICEIGSIDDLKDLQSRLRTAGLDLPHHYHTGGDDPTRRLALLSTFPITPHEISDPLEYPINGSKVIMGRGILDATVTIGDNYSLRLLGVHLKSKREVRGMDQAEMRKNEALLLRHHATAILQEQPDINLLVYGDLNETKNNSPIQIVRGSGNDNSHLEDVYLRDDRGTTWTHNWKYADIYSRFDYVLMSRGVRPEVDFKASYIPSTPDVSEASDHRPLVVTLTPVDK